MNELKDAEQNLRSAFERIFASLPSIPSDEIEPIRSYGIAEDGQTLIVMLALVGGRTPMIQATPGERLSVGRV